MKAKKVIALVMCAAMVAGMSASSVMAADMQHAHVLVVQC